MDQRIPRDAGDERSEVFAELYAAHYRPLVALCRRLVGSRDAEELAQEAFLRAWSSWERYAPARPFWPWVSTIARRLCIDHGRRRQTAQLRGPHAVDAQGSIVPTPEELVEASEEYRWARAALAQLRPDQRRVIRLRDVEGWSYDRIATHEGVTVESVRGSLRRARSRLRVVYARMSSNSPVVVVLAVLRGARHRVSGWAHRAQAHATASGMFAGRAVDAVAALVVLAMGTVPVGLAGGSAGPSLAAQRPTGGGVVAAIGTTTSTSTAQGAGHDGGSPPRVVDANRQMASPREVDVPGTGFGLQVPGGGGSTPESGSFMSFTASPNYQRDHEVYASGLSFQGCAVVCPALFRSTDAGASWTRLQALGFEGGPVMLPPAYPTDHRVFVAGPHALKVSSDAGGTFTPLTPAGGYMAMSPAFSSGDSRILVGAIPGWIYHDDTKAVTPFDAVPQSTSAALSFAYAPAYPRDHRIVVGGTDTTPNTNAIVSACDVSACTAPALLAGATGTPAVMTSRTYSTSGVAYAWDVDKFFRSTDSGRSFASVPLPVPGAVEAVAEDGHGGLYVGLLQVDAKGTSGGLFSSHDLGRTWTRLGTGTALDRGVFSIIALPSGNLLVAPYAARGGGLQCSSDGGQTWASRCH